MVAHVCQPGRGAAFTLISPDSSRREAVARLATGLIPYLLAVQLGFSDIDSSWFLQSCSR
ncbi:hypothetical protein INR49_024159 [Caranx melampygus]|nr:hypothetical protein INR49_024159 [Caranx melampygus]